MLCVIVRICVWCVYENVVCEWGVCVSVCVVCVGGGFLFQAAGPLVAQDRA